MRAALFEAERALEHGEVPVGAVVLYQGQLIARAHNRCEALQDPTAHAEILAIQQASQKMGSYRLVDAEVFVTVEPCIMCAGALVLARVRKVFYGCADPKAGALGSKYKIHQDGRLNHRLQVQGGIREQDCRKLMQSFFGKLRGSWANRVITGEMAESG